MHQSAKKMHRVDRHAKHAVALATTQVRNNLTNNLSTNNSLICANNLYNFVFVDCY